MPTFARKLIAVLTGGVAIGILALAYELSRQPTIATLPKGDVLEYGSKPRRDANPLALWTVTEQLSAHFVLIAHVETRRLDLAMPIAKQIADPIKARYSEVVIYFHRPGRPDELSPRKVQWTPRGGWVEVNYEESPGGTLAPRHPGT